MASIFTTARSSFSISTTSADPSTFDPAGYAALTYSAVCPLESIGEFGTNFEQTTFDDICTGIRDKIKSIQDNGDLELVFGYDDTNAGQAVIDTAADDESPANWHFKLTLPNKQNATGTDAIFYFSGKVMKNTVAPGSATDVVKRNVTVSITTAIVVVDSTAGV